MEGALSLEVEFRFPKPKRAREPIPGARLDCDNLGKAVLDAMQGCFFRNDAQITDLVLRKRYGTPAIKVSLEAVTWGDGESTEGT